MSLGQLLLSHVVVVDLLLLHLLLLDLKLVQRLVGSTLGVRARANRLDRQSQVGVRLALHIIIIFIHLRLGGLIRRDFTLKEMIW